MTLCHLVPHSQALPLVSLCLAPYEVPFLPLSSDLPQAPHWYPLCTPHGPHRHQCVVTLLEPPGHRRWLCQPQPCPLLTAPSPCPPYPPIWAPWDVSGGAARGSGVRRIPARLSLLPGLQPVQHQRCLCLGILQEAGDALVDLTDTRALSSLLICHPPHGPSLPAPSLGCPLWVALSL